MVRVVLLGPPGAGKGTQSHVLKAELGLDLLATGEILRRAADEQTALGRLAQSFMEQGKLVPDKVMIGVIEDALGEIQSTGFLLDGFPRTLAQARALDEMLEQRGLALNAVIFLETEEEKLVERIRGRLLCSRCNASFHTQFCPPAVPDVCDECGHTPLMARSDDDVETLAKRIAVFHKQTEPIIPYYREKALLHTVDGMQTPPAVSKEILNCLKKR